MWAHGHRPTTTRSRHREPTYDSGIANFAAGIAWPSVSIAQDDGTTIAARWCANCHATGIAEQRQAQDLAPPFDDIAARLNPGQIKAALIAPHEPMRGIDLSSRDIATMVEFISGRAP